jgi:hypothetical protein
LVFEFKFEWIAAAAVQARARGGGTGGQRGTTAAISSSETHKRKGLAGENSIPVSLSVAVSRAAQVKPQPGVAHASSFAR